jgi:choline-sulfatase
MQSSERTRNILYIMADQLTPFLTGAYGHPVVKTPNLDRLAQQGIRFDAAYTPFPLCGPARAAMATGKYASELGIYDNACVFAASEVTFCHYLTLAGYDCVASGKLHYVGPDQLHGFARRLTTDIYPEDLRWLQNRDPRRASDEAVKGKHAAQYIAPAIKAADGWNSNLSYDEETAFRAMEYLRAKGWEKRRMTTAGTDHRRQPFFLLASFHHPHDPFLPPAEFWDLYADADIQVPDYPENLDATYSLLDRWLNEWHAVDQFDVKNPDSLRIVRRAYFALVSYIDHKVGQLLNELDRSGLADETIVIFASDHGDMLGDRGMVQKRTFYEWSTRVPLIVRLPHHAQAGTIIDRPVSLLDLMPTFLDIAGVSDQPPMRGHSLLPFLEGRPVAAWNVFAESHAEGVYGTCFMLRGEQYKYVLIVHEGGMETQLFDMRRDPHEWDNLAGRPEFAAIQAELHRQVLEMFDPPAIERAIQASIPVRRVLKQWQEQTGVSWAYAPHFNATRRTLDQYLTVPRVMDKP